MENQQKSNTLKIIVLILVIGIPASIIVYLMTQNKTPDTTNTTPTAVATTTVATTTDTVSTKYKDGTYTVNGKYISPAGREQIPVTITLKDDVITAAEVTSNSKTPMSVNFQEKFISGYKALVIGKNIDAVSLSKVSGSSLTPKGFNDALAQIKVEAQS